MIKANLKIIDVNTFNNLNPIPTSLYLSHSS